jgi:hypothetical protein
MGVISFLPMDSISHGSSIHVEKISRSARLCRNTKSKFNRPGAVVPIGWVAVGNPAATFPPSEHEQIWAVQKTLDFPGTVYGVERLPNGMIDMCLVTERAVTAARRGGWTRLDEWQITACGKM